VPHSDRFVLVDGRGQIRGYYRPSAVAGDLEKLIEAARLLLEEDREG
jgi:cytochrome oxidase Cu insertion factor (SCO1/SenC/PrrC family)